MGAAPNENQVRRILATFTHLDELLRSVEAWLTRTLRRSRAYRETESFFEQGAAAYHLSWSLEWIHALASINGGFPRGMRELLARERDRRPAEREPRTDPHESRKEATP